MHIWNQILSILFDKSMPQAIYSHNSVKNYVTYLQEQAFCYCISSLCKTLFNNNLHNPTYKTTIIRMQNHKVMKEMMQCKIYENDIIYSVIIMVWPVKQVIPGLILGIRPGILFNPLLSVTLAHMISGGFKVET